MIREQISADLKKVLKKLHLSAEKLILEHPANLDNGDYSTNIALKVPTSPKLCRASKSHYDLANEIVNVWRSSGLPNYVAKIEVAPPGFINLWLQNEVLVNEMVRVLEEGPASAKRLRRGKRKIMVEFAHPNTHKQFHIGHLRNVCLGETICRLLEARGEKIIRANYQGDVGLHVAKCLWGIMRSRNKFGMTRSLDKKIELLGKAYVKGAKAYESSPKAKAEIEELNRKIYAGDKEIRDLWKETRAWSLKYFENIYQRLATKFDRLYFESEVADLGKKTVLANLEKGVFQKSEGAVIFPGENYGLHNRVFINKQGLPTYEAKDIGLAKLQFKEFQPSKIIHVVGPEQKGYFEVVFKALAEIEPQTAKKEYHLAYGWVRLKTGKMSSRTGEVVLGEWLLEEAKKRLLQKFKMVKKVAEVVAVGAVKYSLLKFSPTSEIVFDIDESINLEGNSGPYLQYTYARCQSVLRKAGLSTDGALLGRRVHVAHQRKRPNASRSDTPFGLGFARSAASLAAPSFEPEELALLRTLYKFPEVVLEASEKLAPNLICNFLFELSQRYNLFYNRWPILKAESPELIKERLALTATVGQIIKKGLGLLGIETPERM